MTRVLETVGLSVDVITCATSILAAAISCLSVLPLLSLPMQPIIWVIIPKPLKLAATFAAPPARSSEWLSSTTGTGASGEMRFTLPIK